MICLWLNPLFDRQLCNQLHTTGIPLQPVDRIMNISILSHRPALRFKSASRTFASKSYAQGVLHGRKCIITGASRGIGAEIARRFAAEGARCVLVGRNKDLLEGLKRELEGFKDDRTERNGSHNVVVGDVGKEEFWKGLRGEVGAGCKPSPR